MDLQAAYESLVEELAAERVRLVDKAGVWHQRAIHRLLQVVTFGAQSRYLDGYVTTIGRTIFLPPDFAARPLVDRYATLRHELVHVRQFRRFGLLPMAIAYLVLPLPMGLAWCRMRLEREAYEESIRVHYFHGGIPATERLREHIIRQFTSGAYGWMWPFRRAVEDWFDGFVARLELN